MATQLKETFASWKTLNPKKPWQWPAVPRFATMFGLGLAMIAAGYFTMIAPELETLDAAEAKMEILKSEYRTKYQLAANLEAYQKLRVETEVVLAESLRQLPNKSQMEALVNDIHQAALGRGLEFDLFKPNAKENSFEFYAELPITLKIEGTYHDLAEFNAAVARLSRIVTINDMDLSIVPSTSKNSAIKNKDAAGTQRMLMTATAKTYRYLDEAEIKEQQKLLSTNADGKKKKSAKQKAKDRS